MVALKLVISGDPYAFHLMKKFNVLRTIRDRSGVRTLLNSEGERGILNQIKGDRWQRNMHIPARFRCYHHY